MIIAFFVWAIAGLAFMLWDMHKQFRENNGSATPVPYRWWHWPIILPLCVIMVFFFLMYDLFCAFVYVLTFGKIDLGD